MQRSYINALINICRIPEEIMDCLVKILINIQHLSQINISDMSDSTFDYSWFMAKNGLSGWTSSAYSIHTIMFYVIVECESTVWHSIANKQAIVHVMQIVSSMKMIQFLRFILWFMHPCIKAHLLKKLAQNIVQLQKKNTNDKCFRLMFW